MTIDTLTVGDLYAGAHDAFTLLSHKIVPGTLILFDELVISR